MTAAGVLDAPLDLFADSRSSAPADRGRVTLEARLDAAWQAVCSDGRAACPICQGAMRDQGGAGRCESCGSTLA